MYQDSISVKGTSEFTEEQVLGELGFISTEVLGELASGIEGEVEHGGERSIKVDTGTEFTDILEVVVDTETTDKLEVETEKS